jgi:arylsulfatase A-like enzyme
MQFINKLLTGLAVFTACGQILAAGNAKHVVVVVWDGMRPDFISEQTSPNLFTFAKEGVFFKNHHSAYITSTEVNGAAIATGVYPGRNGVVGNEEYRPALNLTNSINTSPLTAIRKADALTKGHFLNAPTIAEQLQHQKKRTVIAGTKTVTILQDRADRGPDALNIDLSEGQTLPEQTLVQLTNALGAFPSTTLPKTNRDLWTTRALTGPLWEKEVPAFTLLWLSEPDYSQHATGPGSKTSLEAIHSSDDNFGRMLAALDKKGIRDQTDVIVISDHGFSTILQGVDLAGILRTNGFKAMRKVPEAGGKDGDIMVVGNGGSVFLYVQKGTKEQITKIVHFLQTQPFCGVVLTRTPVEGAFTLDQARVDSSDAPDIIMSMRWQNTRSTNGTPGLVFADPSSWHAGCGVHASLSPYDLHNICVAGGPDFRRGVQSWLPSGNIDIAPTVLWILGVKPEQTLSGRVLKEALSSFNKAAVSYGPRHLDASYRTGNILWHQYLNYSEVDGVAYFDEGNGEQALME